MKYKQSLLEKLFIIGRKERYVQQQLLFGGIFFIGGLAAAVSSNDIRPLVFLHELGHYLMAEWLGAEASMQAFHTSITAGSPKLDAAAYVRFFLAGYRMEIILWYLPILLLFVINLVRIRHAKLGVHFPIAFLPGYAFGTFRQLGTASDIEKAASLLDSSRQTVITSFIVRETVMLCAFLLLYGFILRYWSSRQSRRRETGH